MYSFPFDRDAARAAALYFTLQEGGSINKMKLVKLMYITERTSLREAESPVFGGMYLSMEFGPLISEVLDALNFDYWQGLVKDGYDIKVLPGTSVPREHFSEWSLELLQRIYEQYGKMDQWKLSELTHEQFSEWKDPGRGRREIINISDIVPESGAELESLAAELSHLRNL